MSTVAAISTGRAPAGISVIRVSGEKALEICDKIFVSVSGKRLSDLDGYTALYGKLVRDGEVIDTAVALVFRAPKSYTGENVVELSCHGGLYVTEKALQAVLSAGAEPAEAGEFTKRAFLNGKMSLDEAEAVMKLISARGEQSMRLATEALGGRLFGEIKRITDIIVHNSALLSAWVDYPYDEIEELSPEGLSGDLERCIFDLEKLIKGFGAGQIILEGVDTAIVGSPNVGKSTLMNLLSGTEKSIVTDIAGTTRDIVEDTVNAGSVTLRLADTAGVRETGDTVESIGVSRAVERLRDAFLVLAVFDGTRAPDEGDRRLMELCRDKTAIAVINKTDLDKNNLYADTEKYFSQTVYISAKTGEGREELITAIEKAVGTDNFNPADAALINSRQQACCEKALEALREARSALLAGVTLDAVTVCLDSAAEQLMTLTGERATELVVNEIFAQFCVGK